MKYKKYALILVIIIILGTLAATWSVLQSAIIGSLVCFIHGLLMINNQNYKKLVYKEIGEPMELKFNDRESFYKDQGVNIDNKFGKFINSEMLIGIFILVETLLNFHRLSFKSSIVSTVIISAIIFLLIIVFDILFVYIAKISTEYSDFCFKIAAIMILVSMPIMFFGLLRIVLK